MEDFYKNFGDIIGFLVIVLIFTMATDEKTTQGMVLLVLLSMVLLNYKEFNEFMKGF